VPESGAGVSGDLSGGQKGGEAGPVDVAPGHDDRHPPAADVRAAADHSRDSGKRPVNPSDPFRADDKRVELLPLHDEVDEAHHTQADSRRQP